MQQSVVELKKATDIMPQEASAHNNLGLSLFENGDYHDAIDCYAKAIQLESQDGKDRNEENLSYYHKNRGLAFYHRNNVELGDIEMAKSDYDISIEKNPDNADNYFNRGNVNLTEGYFDRAHLDFDIAIDKDRMNAKYYHAKGLAF